MRDSYEQAYGFNITVGGKAITIDEKTVNATKVDSGKTVTANSQKSNVYYFTIEVEFEETTGDLVITKPKSAGYLTSIELF